MKGTYKQSEEKRFIRPNGLFFIRWEIISAKKSFEHRFAPLFRRIARNYLKPLISPRFGAQNGARTAHSPAIAPPAFRAIRQKIVCKSVPNTPFEENTNIGELLFMAMANRNQTNKQNTGANTTPTAVDFRVIFREQNLGIRCMPRFFRGKGPKRYGCYIL